MGRSLLYTIEAAFQLWMLVDAVRRRPQYYWYFVIMMPFGAWVYFFVVKIHDSDMAWLKRMVGFDRPPSVKELRYRLKTTPSFANRLALADTLVDAGEYVEAKALYAECVRTHANALEALHGLGYCELKTGEYEAATVHLAQIVDRDFAFREYEAAMNLAEAFEREGHDEEALDVHVRVARASPRLSNEVALARMQVKLGKIDVAKAGLERALEDYEHAPRFVRKRDRAALDDAKKLWDEIAGTDDRAAS
jgi:hypothetical protein